MESRYLRLGVLSLLLAWSLLILIGIAGHVRWNNPLLWLPPALMAIAFFLSAASWEYEVRRMPLVLVAAAAFASFLVYTVGYVFLFGFSVPAG